MSIKSRLARIESRTGDNDRCGVCASWEPCIIVTDEDTGESRVSGSPATCPRCGRETPTFKILKVARWREERTVRPV